MSDVLKPCAHCGGAATLIKDPEFNTYWIECNDYDCGINTGGMVTEQFAITAWNRRTIPTIPVLGKIGDERPASIADHSSDH